MKAHVYHRLWQINRGFQEVIEALAALRQDPAFHRRELDRCAALAKESRAVTGSYLGGVIEQEETDEAGRRYRKRRLREKREDQN